MTSFNAGLPAQIPLMNTDGMPPANFFAEIAAIASGGRVAAVLDSVGGALVGRLFETLVHGGFKP